MKIKTKKIIIYTFCLSLILCTVILSVAAAVALTAMISIIALTFSGASALPFT